MKGIILLGGNGTRLSPTTFAINKHLFPIYNKPLFYYSFSVLMLLGIKEIMVTCHERDLVNFQKILNDGSDFGLKIIYKIQKEAGGIAEALLLAEDFIQPNERFAMILGDNIYYLPHIRETFSNLTNMSSGGGIVLYQVKDPERFGVAEFDNNDKIISLVEKPKKTNSNWAVTGLYFYDREAINFAKESIRSNRGELEITDINNKYLEKGLLKYSKLPRGSVWLDAGLPDSMFEAAEFVKIIEERQGNKIAILEEIAYNMGFINKDQLKIAASKFKDGCEYGDYIKNIILNER